MIKKKKISLILHVNHNNVYNILYFFSNYIGDFSSRKNKFNWNVRILNNLIKYRFINEKACLQKTKTSGIPNYFNTYQLSDGFLVNVNILDTAGQERFKESITSQYYKKADCCLLVYDISNRKSFEELKYYSKKIEEYCKKNIQVILLGNKTDLEKERTVESEEGANYAAKYGYATFMETSCLNNTKVADGFETLIELTHRNKIIEKINKNTNTNNNAINLMDKKDDCSDFCIQVLRRCWH